MVVSDAHVFPGFLTTVLTQLSFQNQPTTFSTCFNRGESRKYSTGYQTHNHQVMSLTRLPLSKDELILWTLLWERGLLKRCGKRRKCWKPAFSFSTMFSTLLQTNHFSHIHFVVRKCFQYGPKVCRLIKLLSLFRTMKYWTYPYWRH